MRWSPEIEQTHLDLSPQDLEFRRFALGDESVSSRATFGELDRHKEVFAFRLQSWPTFVGPRKLAEFKRVSLGICRLLREVPKRVFGDDVSALAEFYRIDSPEHAEILFDEPNGIAESVARGDFLDDGESFKCLEFNFTPNLGGWETGVLGAILTSISAVESFVQSRNISFTYVDTLQALFQHIIRDTESKGLRRSGEALQVAFSIGAEGLYSLGERGRSVVEQAMLRAFKASGGGGRVFFCLPSDLRLRGMEVFLGLQRIHCVLDLSGGTSAQEVYRAFKSGGISFLNGPIEPLLSNKRGLALLSTIQDSAYLTSEERAIVRRHVPWTREVAETVVEHAGERVSLTELMRRRRDSFVLKDATSNGGKGVYFGSAATAAEWSSLIDRALASRNWVVQEKLASRPYLYQSGDEGCSAHDVIWGPFIFGDQYSGAILRMQPKVYESAVNLSLHATEGIILEVPETRM